MNKIRATFVTSLSLIIFSAFYTAPALSECTLTRTSCTHECIETNRQGQCVKTKKICEEVCVQFSVDVSGQDTKSYPPPELQKKESQKKKEPKK